MLGSLEGDEDFINMLVGLMVEKLFELVENFVILLVENGVFDILELFMFVKYWWEIYL